MWTMALFRRNFPHLLLLRHRKSYKAWRKDGRERGGVKASVSLSHPHSTGFRVYSQLPRAREIGKNARDAGTHFHPEFKSNLQIIHVSMPQRLTQDMDGKAGTSGEKARSEPSCFLLCPKCCLAFAFLIPQSHTRGRY